MEPHGLGDGAGWSSTGLYDAGDRSTRRPSPRPVGLHEVAAAVAPLTVTTIDGSVIGRTSGVMV